MKGWLYDDNTRTACEHKIVDACLVNKNTVGKKKSFTVVPLSYNIQSCRTPGGVGRVLPTAFSCVLVTTIIMLISLFQSMVEIKINLLRIGPLLKSSCLFC